MNRDEITRMAREAHRQLVTLDYPGHLGQLDPWTMQLLERFARSIEANVREEFTRRLNATVELAEAAEREACALTCESIARDTYGMENLHEYGECASAIRARGQQ